MSDLDELRRRIAERLGWRDFETQKQWVETWYDTYEDEQLFGVDPDGAERMVPDWPRDANAVEALLDSTGVAWMCYRNEDGSKSVYIQTGVGYSFYDDPENLQYHGKRGDGASFAEAGCRAWLAWMQAKTKQED